MHWSEVRARWDELEGSAARKWRLLDPDSLERVDGDRDCLEKFLRRAYAISREEASYEVEEWLASLTDPL